MFNYMIRTDGISLSVLFIRIDKEGNIAKKKLNNKISTDTKYIEDIQWTDKLKKNELYVLIQIYQILYIVVRKIKMEI
jgi:hypothetical protein